jgi:hypothetical protein
MTSDLGVIADARARKFAETLGKKYWTEHRKGCYLIGTGIPSWLGTVDPKLKETISKCTVPFCPTCKRIVGCHTIIRRYDDFYNACDECAAHVEWRSYHKAERAESDFWCAFEIALAQYGLVLHGNEESLRDFYVCDGINCELYSDGLSHVENILGGNNNGEG